MLSRTFLLQGPPSCQPLGLIGLELPLPQAVGSNPTAVCLATATHPGEQEVGAAVVGIMQQCVVLSPNVLHWSSSHQWIWGVSVGGVGHNFLVGFMLFGIRVTFPRRGRENRKKHVCCCRSTCTHELKRSNQGHLSFRVVTFPACLVFLQLSQHESSWKVLPLLLQPACLPTAICLPVFTETAVTEVAPTARRRF